MTVFIILVVIIFIAAIILIWNFSNENRESNRSRNRSSNEQFESARRWTVEQMDEFFDILIDSLELGIDFDTCMKCHEYFRTHISIGSSCGWNSRKANDYMLKAINELTPNLWRAYGSLQNGKLSRKYSNPNHFKTDRTRMEEANSIGVSLQRLIKYEHLADNLLLADDKFGKNSKEYEVVLTYVFNIADDKNLFDKYLLIQEM